MQKWRIIMRTSKRIPVVAIAAVMLVPAGVHAEEVYPGYGYAPTEDGHIGEKEYSP